MKTLNLMNLAMFSALSLCFGSLAMAATVSLEKSSLCIESKNEIDSKEPPRISLSDFDEMKDDKNAKKILIRFKSLPGNVKCPGGRLVLFYEMFSESTGKVKTFLSNNVCLKTAIEKSFSDKFCLAAVKAPSSCKGKDGGVDITFSTIRVNAASSTEKEMKDQNVFCFDGTKPQQKEGDE